MLFLLLFFYTLLYSIRLQVPLEKCGVSAKVPLEKCSVSTKVPLEKCGVSMKVLLESPLTLQWLNVLNA